MTRQRVDNIIAGFEMYWRDCTLHDVKKMCEFLRSYLHIHDEPCICPEFARVYVDENNLPDCDMVKSFLSIAEYVALTDENCQ